MPSNALRASVLGAVTALMLVAAPVAHAARLTTSAADDAAARVAERYAAATDADDHGVDECERQNRRTIVCGVFVSITVDDATARECSATVTVRLGKSRKRPSVSQSRWECEDTSYSDDEDDAADDDAPVDDDSAYEDEA